MAFSRLVEPIVCCLLPFLDSWPLYGASVQRFQIFLRWTVRLRHFLGFIGVARTGFLPFTDLFRSSGADWLSFAILSSHLQFRAPPSPAGLHITYTRANIGRCHDPFRLQPTDRSTIAESDASIISSHLLRVALAEIGRRGFLAGTVRAQVGGFPASCGTFGPRWLT